MSFIQRRSPRIQNPLANPAVGGGGSDVPIAVGVGSLTLSGLAPTLALGLALPAGALVLTGQAFTPALGLPCPVGTVTLAGTVTSLVFSGALTITIGAGAVAITGATPLLAFVLTVPAGTLTLTGALAGVSNDLPRAIPAGAILLTGQLAGRLVDVPRLTPAGAVTLTGQTLVVALGLPVPAGTVTLTGGSIALSGQIVLSLPAGALVMTGRVPTLDLVQAMAAAAVTLAGAAPSVIAGLPIPVPAGAIAVSAIAPLLLRTLALGAGAVTLTGQLPLQVVGLVFTMPAGALALTAQLEIVDMTHIVVLPMPAGAITLTGQFVGQSGKVFIGAGTLTLTGALMTRAVDRPIPVPTATITITGRSTSLHWVIPSGGAELPLGDSGVDVRLVGQVFTVEQVAIGPDGLAIPACIVRVRADDVVIRIAAEPYIVSAPGIEQLPWQYAASVIRNGAIAYYRLSDDGPTFVESIAGRHGTVVGSGVTPHQPSAIGDGNGGVRIVNVFPGPKSSIDVPASAAIIALTHFSHHLWMRPAITPAPEADNIAMYAVGGFGSDSSPDASFNGIGLIWIPASASLSGIGFWDLFAEVYVDNGLPEDPLVQLHTVNDAGNAPLVDIPPLTWVNPAVTFDGVTSRLYVNGALVRSVVRAGTLFQNIGTLRIGGVNTPTSAQDWNGDLDEYAIYAGPLTPEQIAAQYALRTEP